MKLIARLSGLALLLFPTVVFAQSPLPPRDDPGRIDQDLPPLAPPAPPGDFVIPAPEGEAVPEGADAVTLRLEQLTIVGVTVYPPEVLEPFYQDLLGTEVTLLTLYTVAQRLSAQYRQDGYFLSRVVVPAQTVEAGQVQLQAIEGYVEAVDLLEHTLPEPLQQQILAYSHPLVEERPLRLSTLERGLLLINDLPGITLASTLSPGAALGASRLSLQPRYQAVNAGLGINNQGSDSLGPVRLQGGVFLNSLVLGAGEQLSFTASTTPGDRRQLLSTTLGWRVPSGPDGLQIIGRLAYTRIQPGGALRAFNLEGETYRGSLGLLYPIHRNRRQNLLVEGRVEASNSTIRTTLLESPVILSQDRQLVARVSLQGDRQDATGGFFGSVTLSQGLGGAPGTGDRPLSRAGGNQYFTSVRGEISRRQFLPAGIALEVGARGQLASSSLLVGEQFGLGGNRFGRAFINSQVLGDGGYGLRAEVQRPFAYDLEGVGMMVTQPYLFYDYGQVRRYRPTAAENPVDSLSSAGIGVRHTIGRWLLADVALTFPLSRTDGAIDHPAPQLFFSVQSFF